MSAPPAKIFQVLKIERAQPVPPLEPDAGAAEEPEEEVAGPVDWTMNPGALELIDPGMREQFVDSITLYHWDDVDEQFLKWVPHNGSAVQVSRLGKLPGQYWRVTAPGEGFNGHPVWRRMTQVTDEDDHPPLWIYVTPNVSEAKHLTWAIGTSLCEQDTSENGTVWCYAKVLDDEENVVEQYPKALHFPFWAAKRSNLVQFVKTG